MLKIDAEFLHRETDAAVRTRNTRLRNLAEMIQRYHGPGYGTGRDSHVSFGYEFITASLPNLVGSKPRVAVTARGAGQLPEMARAHKHYLDAWMHDNRLAEDLIWSAWDYALACCATRVTMASNPSLPAVLYDGDQARAMREGEVPAEPIAERIMPRRLIIDPLAYRPESARYIGHAWVLDLEDLRERAERAVKDEDDESWDLQAIKALQEEANLDELAQRNEHIGLQRGEIAGYDLWFPEGMPDEDRGPRQGFNGSFVMYVPTATTRGTGAGSIIRRERPAWVPKHGPYQITSAYPGDGESPWGLSPLMAVLHDERRLDTTTKAMNRAAAGYKRLIVAEGDDAKKIREALHDSIVELGNIERPPIGLDVGGVTREMQGLAVLMQEQLSRKAGFDTPQSGQVDRDATATAVAVADQRASQREGWQADRFYAHVRGVLERVAWYAHYSPSVTRRLGEDAAAEFGMDEPVFVGGFGDPAGRPFELLNLDIEPMSMARITQPQRTRSLLQAVEVLGVVAQTARAYPEARGAMREALRGLTEQLGLPDLAERYDWQLAGEIAAAQLGLPTGGGGGGSVTNEPGQGEAPPAGAGLPGNQTGAMAAAAVR
jgi:hypothetical protein